MALPTRPEVDLKLDFDDLVKELDQFEREAVSLQERIASFITTATEAIQSEDASAGAAEDIGSVDEGAVSLDGVASPLPATVDLAQAAGD